MKKRIIALAAMAVLAVSMATPALAFPAAPCGGYGIMWDADGNFLDREAFEANLDELIEEGLIQAEDRDYFLEQHDWCAEYGGGFARGRGFGRGRGMGCGMGRGW